MDNGIYNILQNLKAEKGTENTSEDNVRYLGTITMNEETKTGDVTISKDIFVVIDEDADGSVIQKFYDENGVFVAGKTNDGKIFPSAEFANENIGFLSEIDALSNTSGISLEEIDSQLEQTAKELGISKKEILSMSEFELNQAVEEKENNELVLTENENDSNNNQELQERNEAALQNIQSKQEINLNERVDDKYTLGDILGVEPGSKLLAVFSDNIENNTNSTRFSLIIQGPDKSLRPASMLEQVGGKYSDKTVYETNRDGTEVEKQSVQSSYKVNSPLVKNGIITVRYGEMGYVKVGYGKTDPTSHRDAITQELRGKEIFYRTDRDVLREFGPRKGVRDISDKIDEAETHPDSEYENGNVSLDEIDGDFETGHIHGEHVLETIKAFDPNIENVFSDREIDERLNKIRSDNPDKDFKEIVTLTAQDLSEDASHMRTR